MLAWLTMLLVDTAGRSGYSEWSNQASNLKSSLKLSDWVVSLLVINQHQQQNVASVSSSSPSTKALSSKASSPNPPCAKSVNFFCSQLPLPVTVTLRVVGPSTNLDLKIENDKHRKIAYTPLEKPHWESCRVYSGIAQIAIASPPPHSNGHPGALLRAFWPKYRGAPSHPGKRLDPPPHFGNARIDPATFSVGLP